MEPFDLVIVGGGVAGLAAALESPPGARIAVVDKGEAGAGSSPLAQGGIAAAVGREDSPEQHALDTIAAGAGICDEAVVRDICAQGPAAIRWLLALGCDFDRDGDALDLAHEGGQSRARSVHWRDATGAEIVRALRRAARGRAERVVARASALAMRDGRCVGVWTEDGPVLGRATLLATGGAGALWAATTNAPGATGDGIALALDAGARCADLEFMQFHPTALDDGKPGRALMTEALRGAGALLLDAEGRRFVDELGPRHVVTRAILAAGGRAFLDCRPVADLQERFPTIVAAARARGHDPATDPIPVAPAAHYFVGGVASGAHGATSLPGLYAAGECAATGMHGANRLAGNSLLEAIVVGRRVGVSASTEPAPGEPDAAPSATARLDPGVAQAMWEGCGPVRDDEGLHKAAAFLDSLEPSAHHRLCGEIVRAAAARLESRGGHLRSDFPQADPESARRSFVKAGAGG